MFRSLLNTIRPGKKSTRPGRRTLSLQLETLEDRRMLSVVPLSSPVDVAVSFQGPQDLESHRAVGEDANGNYRVVYQDSNSGLNTRLFNSSGTPLGSPVHLLNTTGIDSQAVMAMNDSGQSIIAWTQATSTGSTIVAERFSSAGAQYGIPLSFVVGSSSWDPSVAIDTAGDFVVACSEGGGGVSHACGMYESASGAASFFSFPDYGHNTYQPSVAMNASGNFVVAYTFQYSSTDADVYAQRFSAGTAIPLGGPIVVAGSSHIETQPSAAIDDQGNFVVAYTYVRSQSQVNNGRFGSFTEYATEVWADHFDNQGNHLGRVVVASSPSQTASDYAPSAAMSGSGDYIVGYTTGGSFGAYNPADGWSTVRAAAYTSAGVLMSGGITLSSTPNPTANHRDSLPSIAMSRAGHLVAAWQNYGTKFTGDVVGDGVFTQTFVDSPFQYYLLNNTTVLISGGMPTTFTILIDRNAGFTGAVGVSAVNLPSGVTYTVSPAAAGGPGYEYRTITFNAPNNVSAAYNVASQLQLSCAGHPTLTPALSISTTPSYIGSLYGPGTPSSNLHQGLPMTIQGLGFVPGSIVQFGQPGANTPSLQATPTSIASNGSSLTVVVPASAANGVISIIRPGGAAILSGYAAFSQAVVNRLSTTYGYAPGYSSQFLQIGSSLTIYGSGFLPGAKVEFGATGESGKAVDSQFFTTPVSIDPNGNWMTVTVPRCAVNGVISVIEPNGTVSTSSQTFTVYDYRNTFGFSFHNFDFNVSMGTIESEFGGDQVDITIPTPWGTTIDTGVPSPFSLAFLGMAAATMNGDGACFGMALTSQLLAANYSAINAANGLPANAVPTVYNLRRNGPLTAMIEQNHLAQYSAEMINYFAGWTAVNALGGGITAGSVYSQISSLLASGQHPIISMQAGADHAVVAYNLESIPGSSAYYIDVYDPNRPFNLTGAENGSALDHVNFENASRIYVNPASGWSFQMEGNTYSSGNSNGSYYSGGFGTLEVIPVGVVSGSLNMPTTLSGLGALVFGSDPASGNVAEAPLSVSLGDGSAPASSRFVQHTPVTVAPDRISADNGTTPIALDWLATQVVALASRHALDGSDPVWQDADLDEMLFGSHRFSA